MLTPALNRKQPTKHPPARSPAPLAAAPLPHTSSKKNACACGGGCPRCRNTGSLQTKLAISQPGDALEREADQVAAQVLTASGLAQNVDKAGSAGPRISRYTTISAPGQRDPPPPSIVEDVLNSPGRPLNRETRSFFEPRFGHDFGAVRVHSDDRAAAAARALGAHAYTGGQNIVFGGRQYAPDTPAGRRLLAHELTHVVQQSTAPARTVQRSVDPAQVHCAPGQGGAWDDPVAALTSMDDMARDLAARASNALFLATVALPGDPGSVRANVLSAYHNRFGAPPAVSGGFRNRFSGATFATADAAETAELEVLSERFQRVADFLSGSPIRYYCRAHGGSVALPPCAAGVCHNAVARSCHLGTHRTILLCPEFWGTDAQPRGLEDGAMTMIHEIMHILFHVRWHLVGTPAQRTRNASCYDNFIADLFGFAVSSGGCDVL